MNTLLQKLIEALTKYRDVLASQKNARQTHLNAPQAPVPQQTPSAVPNPIPAAPTPLNASSLLDKMCQAICDYEGGPGDLNHINNNPGNLRNWPTQIGTNKGFAVFRTWAEGIQALRSLITNAATGKSASYKPNMSLLDFFEVYAPGNDNNHPLNYAKFVAKRMDVDITFQLKNLV